MKEWKTLRVDTATKKMVELLSRETLIPQATLVKVALHEYIKNHNKEK